MTKKSPKPSPIEILWFQGLVQQQMRDDDLVDTFESLTNAVKDYPDAKTQYVGSVNVEDLEVCMFNELDYWVVYRQLGKTKPRIADFRNAVRACIAKQNS